MLNNQTDSDTSKNKTTKKIITIIIIILLLLFSTILTTMALGIDLGLADTGIGKVILQLIPKEDKGTPQKADAEFWIEKEKEPIEEIVVSEEPTYTLKVEPTEDGLVSLSNIKAKKGERITVIASPKIGYELNKITATNAKVKGDTIIVSGEGDVSVAAFFNKKIFRVTDNFSTVKNGSFNLSTREATVGDTILVAENAHNGYALDTIKAVNANVKGNEVTPIGTGDVHIEVSFKKSAYKITIETTGEGNVTAPTMAMHGETVTLKATPQDKYVLEKIMINDEIVEISAEKETLEFDMPQKDVVIAVDFKLNTFKVTLKKETSKNGKLITTKNEETANDIVTVDVTSDIGYGVDKFFINEEETLFTTSENNSELYFKMPNKGAELFATFKMTPWNIKKMPTANGSFTVSANTGNIGDSIIVSAIPDTGYEVDIITATNATISSDTITVLGTGTIEVTVTYKKIIWQVEKEIATNGIFEVSGSTAKVGDIISVSSVADIGYEVDMITATNATVRGKQITSLGTGDIKVSVSFKKTIWKVGTTAGVNGSFTISEDTIKIGDSIIVSVIPDTGYAIDTIMATNATVSGETVTSSGTGNVEVSVTFKKATWGVSQTPTVNGSFTLSETNTSIGECIKVETTPDTGYEVDIITATHATVSGDTVTSLGTGNVEVSVVFKKITWNVTKEITTHGSFEVSADTIQIGDTIQVTVFPDRGYELETITTRNANINKDKITSLGTGDVNVKVTFKKRILNIIKEPCIGGSFITNPTTIQLDTSVEVTATPNLGHELETITATNATVNGNIVTADGMGDVAITVTFKRIAWVVTSNSDTVANGTFTLDKNIANIGDEVTVTVAANNGYIIGSITATNATVSGNTVTPSGTGDIYVSVVFTPSTVSLALGSWYFPGKLNDMYGIVNRPAAAYSDRLYYYYWQGDGYMFMYAPESIDFSKVKSISVNANHEDYGDNSPLKVEVVNNILDKTGTTLISYNGGVSGWKSVDTSYMSGVKYLRILVYGAVTANVYNVNITYKDGTMLTTKSSSLPFSTSTEKYKDQNDENEAELFTQEPTENIMTNGSYTTYFQYGQPIVYIQANDGYSIGTISIDGQNVEISDDLTEITLEMPQENSNISLTFKENVADVDAIEPPEEPIMPPTEQPVEPKKTPPLNDNNKPII